MVHYVSHGVRKLIQTETLIQVMHVCAEICRMSAIQMQDTLLQLSQWCVLPKAWTDLLRLPEQEQSVLQLSLHGLLYCSLLGCDCLLMWWDIRQTI